MLYLYLSKLLPKVLFMTWCTVAWVSIPSNHLLSVAGITNEWLAVKNCYTWTPQWYRSTDHTCTSLLRCCFLSPTVKWNVALCHLSNNNKTPLLIGNKRGLFRSKLARAVRHGLNRALFDKSVSVMQAFLEANWMWFFTRFDPLNIWDS